MVERDEVLEAEMRLARMLDGEVGYPTIIADAIARLIDAKVKAALSQPNEEGEGK